MFLHYYKSIAKSAVKDFRDGAVVPFKRVWMSLLLYFIVIMGAGPFTSPSSGKPRTSPCVFREFCVEQAPSSKRRSAL